MLVAFFGFLFASQRRSSLQPPPAGRPSVTIMFRPRQAPHRHRPTNLFESVTSNRLKLLASMGSTDGTLGASPAASKAGRTSVIRTDVRNKTTGRYSRQGSLSPWILMTDADAARSRRVERATAAIAVQPALV
jgi:hypothetical protein